MTVTTLIEQSLIDSFLRQDRLPHIWCPGCGIGPALGCFLKGMVRSGVDPDKVAVVSGIGCAGRVAGYVKLDSFHTTHGRALPFATGLTLGNPELNVVVFSGDGDLVAIGGNHLIHAARRNMNMTVICINNFNYGMTGGQVGPTTPVDARSTTSPYGNFEDPFNIPHLGGGQRRHLCPPAGQSCTRAQTGEVRRRGDGQTGVQLRRGHHPLPGTVRTDEQGSTGAGHHALVPEKKRRPKREPTPGTWTITLDGPIVVGTFVNTEPPHLRGPLSEPYRKGGKEERVAGDGGHPWA